MSPVALRLSVMMFLQFFIWGAWYVTAPLYLGNIGFDGADIGWTYSVGPIAALISPLFVGMVADRFFPSERVLGVLHILGGLFMAGSTLLMNPESPTSPDVINWIFLAHTLCYFPTLALTNSLAMHHITDSKKEFPMIRVFGTLGWIFVGLLLYWIGWQDRVEMFLLSGAAAILLGLYSFTLPHTPPPGRGKKISVAQLLGADALTLLKNRSFSVFLAGSFLLCIPLAFYYQLAARSVQQAGIENVSGTMILGQASEVGFMLLMPLFFARLGVKKMLAVGMIAWIARYALFAVGAPAAISWMMIGGILLHGICYDFFFVTGQIYTDQVAPKEIRSQAQGLLAMLTLGLGMLIGAQAAGQIEVRYTPSASVTASAEAQDLAGQISRLQSESAPAKVAQQIEALESQRSAKTLGALRLIDWRSIWLIPAVIAGGIWALFMLFFKEEEPTSA
jgi:nucleoside transporter